MTTRQATIAILVALSGMAQAHALAVTSKAACVLPVADGGEERPSKPNIDGVITQARGSSIEVESTDKVRHALRLDERSHLFTVYGGRVSAKALVPGQAVRIWFVNCDPPKAGQQGRVAVLMLASQKAGEGWP